MVSIPALKQLCERGLHYFPSTSGTHKLHPHRSYWGLGWWSGWTPEHYTTGLYSIPCTWTAAGDINGRETVRTEEWRAVWRWADFTSPLSEQWDLPPGTGWRLGRAAMTFPAAEPALILPCPCPNSSGSYPEDRSNSVSELSNKCSSSYLLWSHECADERFPTIPLVITVKPNCTVAALKLKRHSLIYGY